MPCPLAGWGPLSPPGPRPPQGGVPMDPRRRLLDTDTGKSAKALLSASSYYNPNWIHTRLQQSRIVSNWLENNDHLFFESGCVETWDICSASIPPGALFVPSALPASPLLPGKPIVLQILLSHGMAFKQGVHSFAASRLTALQICPGLDLLDLNLGAHNNAHFPPIFFYYQSYSWALSLFVAYFYAHVSYTHSVFCNFTGMIYGKEG